jgi:hypothetical protein
MRFGCGLLVGAVVGFAGALFRNEQVSGMALGVKVLGLGVIFGFMALLLPARVLRWMFRWLPWP